MKTEMIQGVRELILEQVHYRDLLWQMTVRDLRLRYKQTVMGFGWAVFMPLLNTIVFSVIFTRVAPIEVGIPYPLFAYSGLIIWNFFASSLRFAVVSLTGNPNLVTKVYFPREMFPFSAVMVSLVDFGVASIVLFGLMLYYGIPPSRWLAILPVIVIVHVAFTAAVALLLSMGNLFYRDVKYLFELLITTWMFATSVLYPAQLLGGKLALVATLNPMTVIVDTYRAALIGTPMPEAVAIGSAAVLSFGLLLAAWMVFHRAEFEFAENL